MSVGFSNVISVFVSVMVSLEFRKTISLFGLFESFSWRSQADDFFTWNNISDNVVFYFLKLASLQSDLRIFNHFQVEEGFKFL